MSKTDSAAPHSAQTPAGHDTPAPSHDVQKTTDQQAAAANVVRQQINALFAQGPPSTQPLAPVAQPKRGGSGSSRPAAASPGPKTQSAASDKPVATPDQQADPYHRTHSATRPYDLQQYHTAWQNYYQQYYQRYYEQALQNAKLQIGQTATSAAAQQANSAKPVVNSLLRDKSALIKKDLLAKVGERAKKVRKSPHFVPALSGLLVIALFIFLQYNRVLIGGVKAYVSPGSVVREDDIILVDPTASQTVDPAPKLIIPKINVDVPVVYDEPSMQEAAVQKALERGVVRYNIPGANSLPGQVGNLVIGGHSSNDMFDAGDYKFAFLLADRLQAGDIFYVHYEGKRYIYRVTEKKVIHPNELQALQIQTTKPIATLVTCTPIGSTEKRLLVFAEQISPDPAGAPQHAAQPANASNQDTALPGDSPTLLERALDIF